MEAGEAEQGHQRDLRPNRDSREQSLFQTDVRARGTAECTKAFYARLVSGGNGQGSNVRSRRR